MKVEPFEPLEWLDLRLPSLPTRSRLYSLEPIGIGTPMVESLTSYITRLAEAHNLLLGILLSREVIKVIEKSYLKKGASKGLRELFNLAWALNGIGEMARDSIRAIEQLTLQDNLSHLTLLNYNSILPLKGLLRRHKAWCSACYQEWKETKRVIYEPLLWMIEAVKICPKHHQPLQINCPRCSKQQPLLNWYSRVGFCCHCGYSLTQLSSLLSFDDNWVNSSFSEDIQYNLWMVDSIGELFATTAQSSSFVTEQHIQQAVRLVVNCITQGDIAAFAKLFKFPKNTVWMWHSGKSLPKLGSLLQITYALEIPLLDFLHLAKHQNPSVIINPQKLPLITPSSRKSPKPFDAQQVSVLLQSELDNVQECPPTLTEIANLLGWDRRIIFNHFPELCKALALKRKSYQRAIREDEIKHSCQEVRQIARKLLQEGCYPSESRVSAQMSKPGNFRYESVRSALQEVQQEPNR